VNCKPVLLTKLNAYSKLKNNHEERQLGGCHGRHAVHKNCKNNREERERVGWPGLSRQVVRRSYRREFSANAAQYTCMRQDVWVATVPVWTASTSDTKSTLICMLINPWCVYIYIYIYIDGTWIFTTHIHHVVW
jgi:hypothetical protein